jgi:uncharacterized protein
MLLDFTVENYRSIKEPVTLSAVAQKQRGSHAAKNGTTRQTKSDDAIALPYAIEGWDFEILPVLAIFGPNASGKSNLIQALDCLLMLTTFGNSFRHGNAEPSMGDIFAHARSDAFKLDADTIDKETCFQLRVIRNQVIYVYSVALNQNQIIRESLEYIPSHTKLSNRLFQRIWDSGTQKFEWKNGKKFSGSHLQLQGSVRPEETFMSLLLRLDVEIVAPFCIWLRGRMIGVSSGSTYLDQFLIKSLVEGSYSKHKQSILNIIKIFDLGIVDIDIRKDDDNIWGYRVFVLHKTNQGEPVWWSFDEESLGTRRLFNFAHRMMYAFSVGSLTILDEIEASLHPHITRAIIRMYQSVKTNPRRAQLIFTSHDNTLKANQLLRRDQIWFTQKRADQSTDLYPLSDFKVRNDLAIDKAYLDGRFGAVPILPADDEFTLNGLQ